MSDNSVVRGPRPGDPHPRLRLAALTAVIAGLLLVAAAAFLLSYNGIHQIALQAGVSPRLARLYPVMFDAMLVIASSATLALRSAGWPTRLYVWLSLLLLLGVVAAGDALYAMGIRLPVQPTQAVVAIIPWVLLLMSFVMLLLMLRHWRKVRAAVAASGRASEPAGRAAGAAATAGTGVATWVASPEAAAGRAGEPPTTIDALLEPRASRVEGAGPEAGTAYAGEWDEPGGPGGHDWVTEQHAGIGGYPWAEEQGGHGWAADHAGGGAAGHPEGAEYGEGEAHPEGAEYDESGTAGGGEGGTAGDEGGTVARSDQGAAAGDEGGAAAGDDQGAARAEGAHAGSAAHASVPASAARPGTSTPGTGTGDAAGEEAAGQASPPAAMPAPTPVPHFDRMHSTPTPPQEPDAGKE